MSRRLTARLAQTDRVTNMFGPDNQAWVEFKLKLFSDATICLMEETLIRHFPDGFVY